MITVFCEQKSPRLHYILELLSKEIWGVGYQLTGNWDKFKAIDLPRINYSERTYEGALQIIPHGLLEEDHITPQKIKMKNWDDLPCFFPTKKGDIPFDLFAASFYLVSRYEEYLDFKKDEHGRFPAKSSLAYQEGFLELPLVNLWAKKLGELLLANNRGYSFLNKSFGYISTIDIDMAFCYKHKGIWRNLGGFTRELLKLDLKKIEKRIKVLSDKEDDPFNNFAYQEQIHKQYNVSPTYFILLADHGKFDKNIDYDNDAFVSLVQQLAAQYAVGIHPSYNSNKVKKKLKEEIHRLESITLNNVESSRQHFLKLDIRETYAILNKHNIKEDHSMGYSTQLGFRASICSPFKFYDLEKEKQLDIKVYPFAVMDVALNRFLKLSVSESKERLDKLFQVVESVNGLFISVFHNESLSDFDNWKGWREVYEHILSSAQKHHDSVSEK